MDKYQLIQYFKSLGLSVHTTTKARGHQGFFLKNRIDISKNIPENRVVPTLLHEFAHYIHSKIEPDMNRTGGTLQALFGSEKFKDELIKVTNFVDENSLCVRLYEHKDRVKQKIKEQEAIIKEYYPKFQRSKKFKEFDKYIKKLQLAEYQELINKCMKNSNMSFQEIVDDLKNESFIEQLKIDDQYYKSYVEFVENRKSPTKPFTIFHWA